LHDIPFEFERDSFPHGLKIKIDLNCPNSHSEHEFSKQIRFSMRRQVNLMPWTAMQTVKAHWRPFGI